MSSLRPRSSLTQVDTVLRHFNTGCLRSVRCLQCTPAPHCPSLPCHPSAQALPHIHAFLRCLWPSKLTATVLWPWGQGEGIIHWSTRWLWFGFFFYFFTYTILIVQIIVTYLPDDINCEFGNFLLSAQCLLFPVAPLLCVFLLFVPESSVGVTGPAHLSAPLCPGSTQTFEDHTSGSKGLFSGAISCLQKRILHTSFYVRSTPPLGT